MLSKVFLALTRMSPRLKRVLWRRWYDFLAKHYQVREWSFMNYGYEPAAEGAYRPELEEADEPNRAPIQLYDYVARAGEVAGKRVLEVGSGRGGGASYILRYLKPTSVTGMDFSGQAVALSRELHRVAGLSFVQGDAERMPFEGGSFDAVVNVESSHCYASMARFLGEARRVLRPGGRFSYADFRYGEGEVAALDEQVAGAGMDVVRREDITENVVRSLDLTTESKEEMIRRYCRKWQTRSFLEFAGVRGSQIYERFRKREMVYMHYVLGR
jgi:ubiquinone/menaquinone biosynthesis C-methylase UbiE